MPETLRTAAVTLRAPRRSDARAVFENYAGDPRVTRYMLWRTHAALSTSERYLSYVIQRNAMGVEWSWAITLPDDDECIGMVSVIPDRHKAELGYVLAHDYWGRGIMTGVARSLLHWCFERAGLSRVWATCASANAASARVLEKSGLRREGMLRSWLVFPNLARTPQDCLIYGLVREDFAAAPAHQTETQRKTG
jgi:RimJ/RimL family protein N-acetyltransferase